VANRVLDAFDAFDALDALDALDAFDAMRSMRETIGRPRTRRAARRPIAFPVWKAAGRVPSPGFRPCRRACSESPFDASARAFWRSASGTEKPAAIGHADWPRRRG
jgi:hypothetical protein